MILTKFEIENFRGISHLTLELDRTTVLIGENNSGKTSVLEALNTCMSRGLSRRATPFSEYDFYLANESAEPTDAPPLVLTLTFEESEINEWPTEIDQAFDGIIQILADDRKQLNFRVTATYNKALQDFAVEWNFLNSEGDVLPTARRQRLVTDLQQFAPVFLLTAVRDASQQFQPRSQLWGPFTKNPQVTEEKQQEIEAQLEQINQSVLDNHKPFEIIKDRIAQIGKLVPLADKDLVSVEAVPARIFDLLARTQVKLRAHSGARLPIQRHGAGTQSLSVIFLFEAYLQSRLAEVFDEHTEPILALEEPETHLHPSAIRSLWATLDKITGQKIIATHSGDLLAAVPLSAIRRLARKNGEITVFRLDKATLTKPELQKVTYHVRAKRGGLLFARCWLLVEGETEFTMLPEFARILGHDFDLSGVSCVEFTQCGLKPLIKTAEDFGIEWHLLTDGDSAGKQYVRTASDFLNGSLASERITSITEPDIEHCLWYSGYQDVYERSVGRNQKTMISSIPGDDQYSTEVIKAAVSTLSKPQLSYEIITDAAKPGSPGVPTILKTGIESAIALAGRSD